MKPLDGRAPIVVLALAIGCGALACSSSDDDDGANSSGGTTLGGRASATGGTAGASGTGGTNASQAGTSGASGTGGSGGAGSGGASGASSGASGTSGSASGGTSGSAGATSAGGLAGAGAGGAASGGGGAGGAGGAAGAGGSGGASFGGAAGAGGSGGGVSTRSAGCGKAFTRPNAGERKKITVGGAAREYQFFVPANYSADTAYPFVITFHGGGGSSSSSRAEMHLETGQNVGLVIYLNYVNNGWSYAEGSPDIAYYAAVRDLVEQNFCVDTNRVLITGFSLGAIQSNGIGCTMGGKSVRAIAPIDGSGPYPAPAPASESVLNCPGGKAVGDPAVMVIHGRNDTTALYKYGQWSASFWRKSNGCMETPLTLSAPLQDCVGYQGCRAPVNFCSHNGNHEVPSTAGGLVWAFLNTLK